MKHSGFKKDWTIQSAMDKVGIKWRLFAYLAAFAGILLLLLWLFQIVFLDSFYRAIKASSVRKATDTIVKNIDSADLEDYLESMNPLDGICVLIADKEGNEILTSDILPQYNIYRLPKSRLAELFVQAQSTEHLTLSIDDKIQQPHWDNEDDLKDSDSSHMGEEAWKNQTQPKNALPRPPRNNGVVSLVYGKIAHSATYGDVLVLVNSVITPVNSTVETLRIQFFYIAGILLVLSLLMAAYLSRKISTPIIQINRSAKELAKGRYDTTFEGSGYREIAELSDTLNYASKELSKVERLRRELIANVSHDLRTPLTMIIGYSEMIRDIPGENTAENVQIIIDEANRLTGLVNDMLDISKLQAGTQTLEPKPVELTFMICEILERYRQMTRLEGYRFVFEYQRPVLVSGEESKLSQVVYNLVNNAITYTGADKTITIRQTVDDDKVMIQVMDTGEGIPPENLPYIWERYYKVDKAHKRAAVGTGLGLSIVRSLVELHGGTYGVQSTLGQGSTFWFRLPVLH